MMRNKIRGWCQWVVGLAAVGLAVGVNGATYTLATSTTPPSWFDPAEVATVLEPGQSMLMWKYGGDGQNGSGTYSIISGNIPTNDPAITYGSDGPQYVVSAGANIQGEWSWKLANYSGTIPNAAVEIVWCGKRYGANQYNYYGADDVWFKYASFSYQPNRNILNIYVQAHSRACRINTGDPLLPYDFEPNASKITNEVGMVTTDYNKDEILLDLIHQDRDYIPDFQWNPYLQMMINQPIPTTLGTDPWDYDITRGGGPPPEWPYTIGLQCRAVPWRTPENTFALVATPVADWNNLVSVGILASYDNGSSWSYACSAPSTDQGGVADVYAPGAGSSVLYKSEYDTDEIYSGMASVYCPSGQYVFVCNPFSPTPGGSGSSISQMFPDAPDGSAVYFWNGFSWSFDLMATRSNGSWDSDPYVGQGEAFFFNAGSDYTATFIGYKVAQVQNTWYSQQYNAVGAKDATGGSTADLLYGYIPCQTGDQVLKWDTAAQSWSEFADSWVSCDIYDDYYDCWSQNLSFGVCEGLFIYPQNTSSSFSVTR